MSMIENRIIKLEKIVGTQIAPRFIRVQWVGVDTPIDHAPTHYSFKSTTYKDSESLEEQLIAEYPNIELFILWEADNVA